MTSAEEVKKLSFTENPFTPSHLDNAHMVTPVKRFRFNPILVVMMLLTSTIGGGVILELAYNSSRNFAKPPVQSYLLFWVSFALVFITAGFIASRHAKSLIAPAFSRFAAIASLGIWGALPRLLRGPVPLYFNDEFAQLWQTQRLVQTNSLPSTNPLGVSMAPSFPGLSYLTYVIHLAIPVNVPTLGITIVLIAHALGLFGIYFLARSIGVGSRGSSIAAILYALNPSWLYFDAMYSYESLAIPLAIWSLVAVSFSVRRGTKMGWKLAAAILIPSTIVTHHATGLLLLVAVCSLVLVSEYRQRRLPTSIGAKSEALSVLPVVIGIVLVAFSAWWVFHISVIYGYYSSYFSSKTGTLTSHAIAHGSVLPLFENVCLWLQPLAVGAASLWAWRRLRGTWKTAPSLQWILLGMGTMFFVSLPLVISGSQEVAHRSWAFSWIGLAVILGTAVGTKNVKTSIRIQTKAMAAAAVIVTIATIGSVAASPMYGYLRFPGLPIAGMQGRVDATSADNLSTFFNQNTKGNFFADRYVSGWIADSGNQSRVIGTNGSSDAMPLVLGWNIPSPKEVTAWEKAGLRYIVVDGRIGKVSPFQGNWYQSIGEPVIPLGTTPWDMRALACAKWSSVAYKTGNYTVYEVNLRLLMYSSVYHDDHPSIHLQSYRSC